MLHQIHKVRNLLILGGVRSVLGDLVFELLSQNLVDAHRKPVVGVSSEDVVV